MYFIHVTSNYRVVLHNSSKIYYNIANRKIFAPNVSFREYF